MKSVPWWKDKRIRGALAEQDREQFMQKPPEERERVKRVILKYMEDMAELERMMTTNVTGGV